MKKASTVSEYIVSFPAPVAKRLRAIRAVIKKAAPYAQEKISYGIPAYVENGVLIYFAAFDKHIGVYLYPTAVAAFKAESAKYKTGKGSIQFPHDRPLPLPLIRKVILYRLKENMKKKLGKRKTKK